jgi:hypothetical protein
MIRFYFPSWDGEVFLPDDEGLEFENLEQARAQASRALAEMARDILAGPSDKCVLRMAVTDGGSAAALELRLTL